jgi:hypothetical protein
VERTLDRCLHPDPAARPASALQVSASRPGCDPLAEALASGETPAPEVVAASGSVQGMRALFALLCLGAIFIGTRLTAWLVSIAYAPVLCPLELPPEALANKAREMAEKPGYSERLPGSIHGFDWNAPRADHLRALQEPLPPAARGPDQAFTFWLRESPNAILMKLAETQNISWTKPAFDIAGMRRIRLDPHGDPLEFEAIPQRNTMLIFICRIVLRRNGAAAITAVILFAIMNTIGSAIPLVDLPCALVTISLFVSLIIRVGILCAATAFCISCAVNPGPEHLVFRLIPGGACHSYRARSLVFPNNPGRTAAAYIQTRSRLVMNWIPGTFSLVRRSLLVMKRSVFATAAQASWMASGGRIPRSILTCP